MTQRERLERDLQRLRHQLAIASRDWDVFANVDLVPELERAVANLEADLAALPSEAPRAPRPDDEDRARVVFHATACGRIVLERANGPQRSLFAAARPETPDAPCEGRRRDSVARSRESAR